MYKVGDFILYSNEGVCRVESIDKLDVEGIDNDKLYYNLNPVCTMGNIYVPVDTKLFIRPVIDYEEAQRIIRLIPSFDMHPVAHQSRKMLEEQYKSYIQSHDCIDLIRLLKLIHRKGIETAKERKKLGAIDERFRRKAEELLFGELSVALDIPKDEVRGYIESQIRELEIRKSLSVVSVLKHPGQAHG